MNAQRIATIWEGFRERVGLRFPRALAFYRRHLGPRLGRGDRFHFEFSGWATRGVQLTRRAGTKGVRFDEDGIWIDDGDGCLWAYTPGQYGSALWTEFGAPHEIYEIHLLAERLPRDGGVFIDVGANVGSHSIKLARLVPGLRALAFEPVASTFETLLRNATKNGVMEQIHAQRIALSDRNGTVRLTTGLQGENFVVPEGVKVANSFMETVECQTLDDVVKELTDHVDAIKCDVEGAELMVLRGAVATLGRFRPTVMIEVEQRHSRRYGHQAADVFSLIADYGYSYERVVGEELRPPSGSLARDLAEGRNFLFTG